MSTPGDSDAGKSPGWIAIARQHQKRYGAFGVSLALVAFVGIIASFWVWIAAVMGVWWERKAGPAASPWRSCQPTSTRHKRPGRHTSSTR